MLHHRSTARLSELLYRLTTFAEDCWRQRSMSGILLPMAKYALQQVTAASQWAILLTCKKCFGSMPPGWELYNLHAEGPKGKITHMA